MTSVQAPAQPLLAPPATTRSSLPLVRWFKNPWRKPRILEAITWLYLVWSLLPVLIAVLFSFNSGKSRSVWQGFSLRWYWKDPNLSVWHDADLHTALVHTLVLGVLTTVIAVPLGVAFALGLDRWRGRLPAFWNIQMLLSFVVPEIILGVSLYFVASQLPIVTPSSLERGGRSSGW